MNSRRFFLSLWFAGMQCVVVAQAGEHLLFNGKDLDGWTVTKCDVAVEDGALSLKAGEGFIQSKDRFRDFVLELDFKALKSEKYDSGIYIRCEPPPATGRPWPTRYQVNLKEGDEGKPLGMTSTGQSTGLVKKGDWNHLRIAVKGATVEVQVDGHDAWKGEGIEPADGFVGIQSEVTGGGQWQFRNIKLTDIE